MILPVQRIVRTRIAEAVTRLYGIAADDPVLAAIAVDIPPRRALGDLAVPLAFELARRLRKAPRVIAQELAAALGQIDGVSRIEAAPNGYINFFLDRVHHLTTWLSEPPAPPAAGNKTIVEHTAINPNKAAHIGHLRNAALGDAFGRLLRYLGRQVEIQNYIDDTGVQVADVALGFRELEGQDLAGVRRLADTTRFDYYCWDLYARVTEWYEADKERLKIRSAALHDIEHGGNDTAEMAQFIADRIVRRHLETMARLNIGYDLLTWEGDILRLHFWTHAFEFLKKTGAVFLQTEGKLKGCWVMRIEDEDSASGQQEDEAEAEQREKVIVRSDGTVTYVGKDMAYQLWKFGLLGRDFHYRLFAQQSNGTPLWSTSSTSSTSSTPADGASVPAFGHASWVCNVIDTRQSYLQKLVKQALAALGYHEQASHSVHYSYEMVALSHSTARELGYDTSADADRPFVEVSGRKGLGVKADDLIDRLTDKASQEVASRNPDLSADETRAYRGIDRDRRGPVLHGQVLARQGHRVRHRRGLELRGRKRSLSPVRGRSRQQHLQQAEGTAGSRRARGHCRARRDPGRHADVGQRRITRGLGPDLWRRPASTRSWTRRSARWSSPSSPSTPSASRNRSTPSTIAIRSSMRRTRTPESGARRPSPSAGTSSPGR